MTSEQQTRSEIEQPLRAEQGLAANDDPGQTPTVEAAASDDAAAAAAEPSAEEQLAELRDRLLRTLAEMENMRARTAREVDDTRKYAVTGFARDLLGVADNLGRALASVPPEARESDEAVKNLMLGVEM